MAEGAQNIQTLLHADVIKVENKRQYLYYL
jgi:hypothetical protein